MTNTPLKITPELTFHELSEIVKALEEQRSGKSYALSPYTTREDKDGFVDEDGRVVSYRVTDAERALVKRADLADLIGRLTGETPDEDVDVVAKIRDARRRLDAQEAADKAAEAEAVTAGV